MKTIKTIVYDFDELSADAKEKAIKDLYIVNVEPDWFDCTYDDADDIGIKISGFDIGRGAYCKGDFIESAEETAQKIVDNHGKDCETYKTATTYLKDRTKLVKKYSDGKTLDIVAEDNEYNFDNDCDNLDYDFLLSILEDYRILLSKVYDYLTSEEAIVETIEANKYTFTIDGTMKNA